MNLSSCLDSKTLLTEPSLAPLLVPFYMRIELVSFWFCFMWFERGSYVVLVGLESMI